MGIDLLLLPIHPTDNTRAFAHTTLEVQRRHELLSLIRTLPSQPVPPFLETLVSMAGPQELEAWVQGDTQTDSYGDPLRCVRAEDLWLLANHPAVEDNFVNRATWAYLVQLPEDMLIAIYWA
jgi:hypothetical protein